MSYSGTMNKNDWKEWAIQTAIYSVAIPVLLVFLTTLQNGLDTRAAGIAALYALISALVNLLKKYSEGPKQIEIPTTSTAFPESTPNVPS